MTGLPAIAQDAPPDFSTERIGADKPQKPRSPSLQRVSSSLLLGAKLF